MFTIEMLPAAHGDCLWLEYGPKKNPYRVLIDGGRDYSYKHLATRLEERLGDLPKEKRAFELLVITHIDSDHIGGVLELLEANPLDITIRDTWFNGYHHLPETPPDLLGPVQGERLTDLLVSGKRPWNAAVEGEALAIAKRDTFPVVKLKGGLTLTLLSPTLQELHKLRPQWKKEVLKAGLVPGHPAEGSHDEEDAGPSDRLGGGDPDPKRLARSEFREDTSKANGSSIALLAEYRGKRCLLAGDAFPSLLARSLETLAEQRRVETLPIDLLKVSHHGGKKNTSNELLQRIDCKRFLFSTDGSSFDHPHDESVGRAIMAGGEGTTLYFNYRSDVNARWDTARLKREYGYETVYPEPGTEGLIVEV
jgi:hypothetical protein